MEQPPTTLMNVAPWMRWLIWIAAVTVLSVALLTRKPVEFVGTALPPQTNFLASKTAHLLSYFTLALLTAWLPVSPRWRWWLLSLLVAHAFATEVLQQFVPPRTGSLRDAGIDLVGLALGVALTWRCWRG